MVEQDKDINSNSYALTIIPPITPAVTAKFDSGASKHYFTKQDTHILLNQQQLHTGPKVKLPNDVEIQATSSGLIPLHSSLSPIAS